MFQLYFLLKALLYAFNEVGKLLAEESFFYLAAFCAKIFHVF